MTNKSEFNPFWIFFPKVSVQKLIQFVLPFNIWFCVHKYYVSNNNFFHVPAQRTHKKSPKLFCYISDNIHFSSVPFSSVTQLCSTLCDPMNRSTPGLPVHHQLPEFTQTHVHWVGDAIQPSHPLSPPSPPALNISQPQGLFKWVSSLHKMVKVLAFQLQHQSFQWTLRTDFL